jgi:hypothetical protein
MSKFHVNDKGEAGQCRANNGGCPFGGEAQHYSSPEIARQAYELSMAGEQFATVKKSASDKAASERVKQAAEKLKNTLDERLGRTNQNPPHLPLSREDFDPALHEGFEYDEVFYDEDKRRKDIAARIERQFPNDTNFEERLRNWMNSDYQHWRRDARFEKAKSFEKNVPIRLIPTGGKVEVSQHTADRYSNKAYRPVGRPVQIEGSGEIVGRYRDSMNEWDYVQPETTFNLGHVDPDKKIDSHWKDENLKAQRLAAVRSKYSDTAKPNELTKDNYEASKWGGIPLNDLKFDQQAILDRVAARGNSETSARETVVREKRIWDSKARTRVASPNEDGVPMRLIPVGAEIAVSPRRYDGTVDVGTVIAPSVKEDGSVMGRVKTKGGIVEFSPGTLHNVGYFDEGKKLSPRWKFSNEMAEIVKEQRSRVEDFEQKKK